MKKTVAMVLLSVFLSSYSYAGDFSANGISLIIPDGFEGPVSQSNTGATTYGFTKPSATPPVRTLLQLTFYDPGKAIPKLSREEMVAASDKYLLDFLGGVERRRTSFHKSAITHISLGGIPASKISWGGNLPELQANGVMYCAIVGNTILSLHTQDAGNDVTPNMLEAIKSIEALTFAKQGQSPAAPVANSTSTGTEPAPPAERQATGKRQNTRLSNTRDIRNCLDLKTNEEIAKCASH